MEKRRRPAMAVILVILTINYLMLKGHENIRAIQFVYIFVIGAISGLLINEFVALFKARRK